MTAGAYASCRGMGLTPGRYACKDDDWNEDYICVADVREMAKSFTIRLDLVIRKTGTAKPLYVKSESSSG